MYAAAGACRASRAATNRRGIPCIVSCFGTAAAATATHAAATPRLLLRCPIAACSRDVEAAVTWPPFAPLQLHAAP